MDILSALKDGYSKSEVMEELGRRTGMNYKQALSDGYSEDDVLGELNRRDLEKKATQEQQTPGLPASGVTRSFAQDAPSPDILEKPASLDFIKEERPKDTATVGGEAWKGAKSGMRSFFESAASLGEHSSKLTGPDYATEGYKKIRKDFGKAQEKDAPAVGDIMDIESGSDFGKWASWNMGQMGGQMLGMLPFMFTGGPEAEGAVTGFQALKGLVTSAPGAAGQFTKFLAQWAKPKAVDIPIGVLEGGSIAGGQLDEVEQGKDTELHPFRGLAAAFVATKLEELGAENAVNNLIKGIGGKKGNLIKRIAQSTVGTGVGEGTEEFFQAYAEQFGINPKDIASKETFMQAVNGAAAGFIGGFGIGGVTGSLSRNKDVEPGPGAPDQQLAATSLADAINQGGHKDLDDASLEAAIQTASELVNQNPNDAETFNILNSLQAEAEARKQASLETETIMPQVETKAEQAAPDYSALITTHAEQNGIEPSLLSAVAQADGGLMAISPQVSQYMGIQDAQDPDQNLEGGARYLSALLQHYQGDEVKALAAYKMGVAAVNDQFRIESAPKEVQDYIASVQNLNPTGLIDSGLRTGQVNGQPFGPNEAVSLIQQKMVDGTFTKDHLNALKDKHPVLSEPLNDLIAASLAAEINQAAAPITQGGLGNEESQTSETLLNVSGQSTTVPYQHTMGQPVSIPFGQQQTPTYMLGKEVSGPKFAERPQVKTAPPAPLSKTNAATVGTQDEKTGGATPLIGSTASWTRGKETFSGTIQSIDEKNNLKIKAENGKIYSIRPDKVQNFKIETGKVSPPDEIVENKANGEAGAGSAVDSGIAEDIVSRIDKAVNDRARSNILVEEGVKAVPGIRLQDAEEAGRWAYVVAKGDATQEQFDEWIDRARKENRISKPEKVPEKPPKKEPPKKKGPQNLITRIMAEGGLKVSTDYSNKYLKQYPDLKRIIRNNGVSPDDMAAILKDEGYLGFETGDDLIELLKDGKGKETFTPENLDDKIESQIRSLEDEWIEEQLANLTAAEEIDPGAIEESRGDILDGLEGKIAEEGLSEADAEAALDELSDFFESVVPAKEETAAPQEQSIKESYTEKAKAGTLETAEIPGASFVDTFTLAPDNAGLGEKGKPHLTNPTANMFEEEKPNLAKNKELSGKEFFEMVRDRAIEKSKPYLSEGMSDANALASLEMSADKVMGEITNELVRSGKLTDAQRDSINSFNKEHAAWEIWQHIKKNGLLEKKDTYLPVDWTEAEPGRMATNTDQVSGGIVDQNIASGKWFVIPNNNNIKQMDGFATRKEALDALQNALAHNPHKQTVTYPKTNNLNKYPVFVSPDGREYHCVLYAIDMRLKGTNQFAGSGWEWYGFEKSEGDTYFGLVDGFEKELGYFSAGELRENGIKPLIDPKGLQEIAPPRGWKKKEDGGESDTGRALIGAYAADENEAREYPVAAENAFKKDLKRYAKELNDILGWEVDRDKKGKDVSATVNIAPVGGDGTIILWKPNSEYGIYIDVSVQREYNDDSLKIGGIAGPIMYRATEKKKKYTDFVNRWENNAAITPQEFAEKIKAEVDFYDRVPEATTIIKEAQDAGFTQKEISTAFAEGEKVGQAESTTGTPEEIQEKIDEIVDDLGVEVKKEPTDDLTTKSTAELISDIFAIINDHIGQRGSLSFKENALDESLYQKIKPYLAVVADRARARALDVKAYLLGAVDSMPKGPAKEIYESAADRYIEDAKQPVQGAETAGSPSAKVADFVKTNLENGKSFTSNDLFGNADDAFGGTQAQGAYTSKDAYDAMELGVNKYVEAQDISPAVSGDEASDSVLRLKEAIDLLPTQTKRTEETDQFQQFSTPPPLAYLANWVANIQKGETYLEPSAGIGGLAVFGKVAGAKVIVNELSPRRAEVIKEMGFDRLFTENAEQINNILPADVKPSVIVMNPPFSATAGRVEKTSSKEGFKHVEQALKRLLPNGRAVIILGKSITDTAAFKFWWKSLGNGYTLRADIGISGREYQKYGTTYGNQVIVIDKITSSPDVQTIKQSVWKVEDAIDILQGVRDARITTGQPGTLESEGQGVSQTGQGNTRPQRPILPATGKVGDRESQNQDRLPSGGTNQPNVRVESGERNEVRNEGEPRVGRPDNAGQEPGRAGVVDSGRDRGQAGGPDRVQQVEDGIPVESRQAEAAKGELTDSVYESYTPSKLSIGGAKKHPGNLVESAAMGAVFPPDITYQPKIPKSVIESGKLSDAQMETVVYAGQAHSETLPNGQRRGYFIGDGTGVGKGREISGIILDNWNQGRRKAVWISQNSPLIKDAHRDAEGVGLDPKRIFDFSKIKAGKDVTINEGIAFLGYATLGSKGNGEVSRVEQIVNWLGPDFDGVIAFDEAHNMGNAVNTQGARGVKQAAQKALAGIELQNALPNARVIYVSATGATEVSNFSYLERLGLWGEGTPFASKSDFITKISAGGIAAMELVARDMKAMGNYLARSLSYEDVKYDKIEHELTPDQREIYNELARAWQMVLANINEALQETGGAGNANAKSKAMSAFWGSHQRFFNQIITALQTPATIKAIEEDIKNGHSAIIQLVNTNEAAQERALSRLEEDDSLEDMDMTPREQLMEYIRNSFPVAQYQEVTDADGNVSYEPVLDSNGNPVENAEAVAMREELLDRLGSIRVPDGPLEMIINHFGADKVAEVTGRSRRVVEVTDETGKHRVIEKRSKAKAMVEADAFMNDKRQILVFSQAGGTGRSYHADNTAENRRLRRHYLLQAGWRADVAIQGFGRSHRTNQAQAPEYILVTTDIVGQKRFISSIARRLDQLGALTKGERKTGSGGFFTARDNLESTYASEALTRLIEDIYHHSVPGMDMSEFMQQTGLTNLVDRKTGQLNVSNIPTVPKFLNRLLSMELDAQTKTFEAFSERIDQNIRRAMENGTLDVGMETLRAKKVEKVQEQSVFTDRSGAETKYVELRVTQNANHMDFARAQGFWKDSRGFYKNLKSDQVWLVSTLKNKTNTNTGSIEGVYHAIGPKMHRHDISEEDLSNTEKYVKLTDREAEGLWTAEYDELPKEISYPEHLITGTLLPIWDRLPQGHSRIIRVQTDKGERMIGRIIQPTNLQDTLRRLGASSSTVKMSPKEILDSVKHSGMTIELANGWTILRRKVSGENRVEIKGVEYNFLDELKNHGAFTERISWETRLFIPTSAEGVSLIEHIIKNRPVVNVIAPVNVRENMGDDETAPRYSRSLQKEGEGVNINTGGTNERRSGTINRDQERGQRDNVLPEVQKEHERRVGTCRQVVSQDAKAPYRLKEACGKGQGLAHYPQGYDHPDYSEARKLASAYGLDLIPFKDTTDSVRGFINGKAVFVNFSVQSDIPFIQVAAHEISHYLSNRPINKATRNSIDVNSKAFNQYLDHISRLTFGEGAFNRGYRLDVPYVVEEYAADLEAGVKEIYGVKLADGLKPGKTIVTIQEVLNSQRETEASRGRGPPKNPDIRYKVEQGTATSGPEKPRKLKTVEELVAWLNQQSKAASNPLEDAPERKQSSLSKKAYRQALKSTLIAEDRAPDVLEYDVMPMQEQADLAADLINRDIEKAKRIALGQEEPEGKLRKGTVYRAIELWAHDQGDTELIAKLIRSPISLEMTKQGQEIAATRKKHLMETLGMKYYESPVNAVKDVEDTLAENVEKKTGKRASKEAVAEAEAWEKKLSDLEQTIADQAAEIKKYTSQEYIDELIKKHGKEGKPHTAKPRAEYGAKNKVVTRESYEQAKQEWHKMFGSTQLHAGIDPSAIATLTKIGTYHFEAGARQFAAWAQKVVDDTHPSVKPYLKEVFEKAKSAFGQSLTQKIKKGIEKGRDLGELQRHVTDLTISFIEEGITDGNEVVEAVHNELRQIIPEITLEETRDAISGYGNWKPLTHDDVLDRYREIKQEQQLVAKIRDLEEQGAMRRTGTERQEMTQLARDLNKQVHALKIKYGMTTTEENQLPSALESYKKRLNQQIADLDEEITTKQRIVKERFNLELDAEAKELIQTRDSKKAEREAIFGKPEMTDEQRIKLAIQSAKKATNEYNRRIAEHDFSFLTKKGNLTSEELTKARKDRDDAKKAYQELREAENPGAAAMKALETRLNNELNRYKQMIANRDFVKQERKPRNLSPELKRLMEQRDTMRMGVRAAAEAAGRLTNEDIERIAKLASVVTELREAIDNGGDRLAYGAAVVAYHNYIEDLKGINDPIKTLLSNRIQQYKAEYKENPGKAIFNLASDSIKSVFDNSVAMVASFDDSFMGRQGLKVLFTHPSAWWPGAKNSVIDFIKTFGGQETIDAMKADIYSRPNFVNGSYGKAGIIAAYEEQYPANLAERAPVIGRVFKASEAAFVGSGMRMRADLYDLLADQAKSNGKDVLDQKEFIEPIGKLINNLTARGSWGKHRGESRVTRLILWAPKMLMANINTLVGVDYWTNLRNPTARREAGLNWLKVIGTTALIMAVASALGGDDDWVEWDPRSTDFGKIKIGDTRFDITGGMGSIVVLAARIITGKKKSATTGIVQGYTGDSVRQSRLDAFVQFLINKTTPPMGIVRDWLEGKTPTGERFTPEGAIYRAMTPIAVQNFIKLKDSASADRLAGAIVDVFGINTSSYSDSERQWNPNGSQREQKLYQRVGEKRFQELNKEYNTRVDSHIKELKRDPTWQRMSDEDKQAKLDKGRERIKAYYLGK